jgi:hypothetical protein
MINANLHKYGSGLLTDISGAVCLAKNITTNYVFTIDIKECPGKTIYFNFDSIFGDFF